MDGTPLEVRAGGLAFEEVAGLSALDIAAGRALELGPRRRVLSEHIDEDPIEAIEALLAPAVRRSPCLVAFSGGRHSTLILWLAARVARREGVLPPIPATLRHPDLLETGEVTWQEGILRQQGLDDWLRIDVADELDLVGPVAEAQLRRHGLLYPATTHALTPLLDAAHGGTLIVGFGGAELQGRRRFARRRGGDRGPAWMTGGGRSELRRRERGHGRRGPWDGPSRSADLALQSARRIAVDHRVDVRAPFTDSRFLSALARTPRRRLPDSISALLAPPPDPAPSSRRFFLWHSRAFAQRWSGAGLDHSLVDMEALRAEWLRPEPDLRTALALQSAWLDELLGGRGPAPFAEVA